MHFMFKSIVFLLKQTLKTMKNLQSQSLTIYNLSNPAFCEAQGLAKVFQAYADNCSREDIMQVGFNENSGYVYIALENGISICSMLGREVEYLITNFEDGEETFFDEYEIALNNL